MKSFPLPPETGHLPHYLPRQRGYCVAPAAGSSDLGRIQQFLGFRMAEAKYGSKICEELLRWELLFTNMYMNCAACLSQGLVEGNLVQLEGESQSVG
jgi:hypothetical protein